MENDPLISIIIPVYNTEQYLERCVNSLLSQSFANFEILLINDGSTDDSGEICDEYAKLDKRIKVFHKENGGVSSARNLGLSKAKGDWITFVDSDDELLPEGLNLLISIAETEDVDCVIAGYDIINTKDGTKSSTSNLSMQKKVLDKILALRLIYRYEFYPSLICSKLYRSSVINRNHLSFDENIYYSEDKLFIVDFLCKSERNIYYTTMSVYKYYLRSNSAMVSLEQTFNYKSITGYYATLIIYSIIKRNNIPKDIIFYSIEDIVNSYDYIHFMMNKFLITDFKTKTVLKQKLFETISYKQYYSFRIRQILSLLKRKMTNIVKIFTSKESHIC